MALTNKLIAIADAIREKTGETGKYTLDEMPSAISGITGGGEGGGYDIPEEAFVITGDCDHRFANNGWNWFVEKYGERITTKDIKTSHYMFAYSDLTDIPFEINIIDGGAKSDYMFANTKKLESVPSIDFKQTSYKGTDYMFYNCGAKEIGTIKNLYPEKMTNMFANCGNLRFAPQFENLNMTRIYTYTSAGLQNVFQNCHSLRSISNELIKVLYTPKASSYLYAFPKYGFYNCYSLDEVTGVVPITGTCTSDFLVDAITSCGRLKDFTFALQEDGTPYVVKWKSQVLDFSKYVGWLSNKNNVLNYNSGITEDKQVTDADTYEILKDDPDWFTTDVAYSRYNHDSAVNTINTLPDTSAYLASAGGTNTIKFKGVAGSLTDGGAINTLTEEEIAVATAKGWTVTFV